MARVNARQLLAAAAAADLQETQTRPCKAAATRESTVRTTTQHLKRKGKKSGQQLKRDSGGRERYAKQEEEGGSMLDKQDWVQSSKQAMQTKEGEHENKQEKMSCSTRVEREKDTISPATRKHHHYRTHRMHHLQREDKYNLTPNTRIARHEKNSSRCTKHTATLSTRHTDAVTHKHPTHRKHRIHKLQGDYPHERTISAQMIHHNENGDGHKGTVRAMHERQTIVEGAHCMLTQDPLTRTAMRPPTKNSTQQTTDAGQEQDRDELGHTEECGGDTDGGKAHPTNTKSKDKTDTGVIARARPAGRRCEGAGERKGVTKETTGKVKGTQTRRKRGGTRDAATPPARYGQVTQAAGSSRRGGRCPAQMRRNNAQHNTTRRATRQSQVNGGGEKIKKRKNGVREINVTAKARAKAYRDMEAAGGDVKAEDFKFPEGWTKEDKEPQGWRRYNGKTVQRVPAGELKAKYLHMMDREVSTASVTQPNPHTQEHGFPMVCIRVRRLKQTFNQKCVHAWMEKELGLRYVAHREPHPNDPNTWMYMGMATNKDKFEESGIFTKNEMLRKNFTGERPELRHISWGDQVWNTDKIWLPGNKTYEVLFDVVIPKQEQGEAQVVVFGNAKLDRAIIQDWEKLVAHAMVDLTNQGYDKTLRRTQPEDSFVDLAAIMMGTSVFVNWAPYHRPGEKKKKTRNSVLMQQGVQAITAEMAEDVQKVLLAMANKMESTGTFPPESAPEQVRPYSLCTQQTDMHAQVTVAESGVWTHTHRFDKPGWVSAHSDKRNPQGEIDHMVWTMFGVSHSPPSQDTTSHILTWQSAVYTDDFNESLIWMGQRHAYGLRTRSNITCHQGEWLFGKSHKMTGGTQRGTIERNVTMHDACRTDLHPASTTATVTSIEALLQDEAAVTEYLNSPATPLRTATGEVITLLGATAAREGAKSPHPLAKWTRRKWSPGSDKNMGPPPFADLEVGETGAIQLATTQEELGLKAALEGSKSFRESLRESIRDKMGEGASADAETLQYMSREMQKLQTQEELEIMLKAAACTRDTQASHVACYPHAPHDNAPPSTTNTHPATDCRRKAPCEAPRELRQTASGIKTNARSDKSQSSTPTRAARREEDGDPPHQSTRPKHDYARRNVRANERLPGGEANRERSRSALAPGGTHRRRGRRLRGWDDAGCKAGDIRDRRVRRQGGDGDDKRTAGHTTAHPNDDSNQRRKRTLPLTLTAETQGRGGVGNARREIERQLRGLDVFSPDSDNQKQRLERELEEVRQLHKPGSPNKKSAGEGKTKAD